MGPLVRRGILRIVIRDGAREVTVAPSATSWSARVDRRGAVGRVRYGAPVRASETSTVPSSAVRVTVTVVSGATSGEHKRDSPNSPAGWSKRDREGAVVGPLVRRGILRIVIRDGAREGHRGALDGTLLVTPADPGGCWASPLCSPAGHQRLPRSRRLRSG